MAVYVVAKLKVKPGMGKDLEAAAKPLREAVMANESGCLFYNLTKIDDETYMFVEAYKTMADVEAHGKSDHFKQLSPAMGPALAGRPEIVRAEGILE